MVADTDDNTLSLPSCALIEIICHLEKFTRLYRVRSQAASVFRNHCKAEYCFKCFPTQRCEVWHSLLHFCHLVHSCATRLKAYLDISLTCSHWWFRPHLAIFCFAYKICERSYSDAIYLLYSKVSTVWSSTDIIVPTSFFLFFSVKAKLNSALEEGRCKRTLRY